MTARLIDLICEEQGQLEVVFESGVEMEVQEDGLYFYELQQYLPFCQLFGDHFETSAEADDFETEELEAYLQNEPISCWTIRLPEDSALVGRLGAVCTESTGVVQEFRESALFSCTNKDAELSSSSFGWGPFGWFEWGQTPSGKVLMKLLDMDFTEEERTTGETSDLD